MPEDPHSGARPGDPTDWQGFVGEHADTIWRACARAAGDPEEGRDVAAEVLRRLAERWPEVLDRWQDGGPASFRTWLAVVVRNLAIDVLRSLHGRIELPRSVARRPAWQQQLYRLLYRDGLDLSAARSTLLQAEPGLAPEAIAEAAADIDRQLPAAARRGRPRSVPLSALAAPDEPAPDPVDETGPTPEGSVAADQTAARLGDLLGELSGDERTLLRLYFLEGLSATDLLPVLGGRTRSQVYNRIHAVTSKLKRRAAELDLAPADLEALGDRSWTAALHDSGAAR